MNEEKRIPGKEAGALYQAPPKQSSPLRGKPKVQKRTSKKAPVIVLAILVVVFAAGLLFYTDGISAVNPKDKTQINVTVNPGSSANAVLTLLDQKGLIKNKICAKICLKLLSPGQIQANTYSFSKSMNLTDMYKAMETGDPAYVERARVTIIEGATIPQAAAVIAARLNISEQEVINKWRDEQYLKFLINRYWFLTDDILNPDLLYPLEGYFYPETYFITSEEPTVEDATILMLDQMDKELTPLKGQIESELHMSVHEFLSFASVVEGESLHAEDRPKIAGVFMNRLKQKMPLQSCITVLYALEVKKKRPNITAKETKIDSKYNTYINKGLPVGPVSTVRKATMEACLKYEKNKYLFFFATEDGTILYSKTYEEHNKTRENNKWY